MMHKQQQRFKSVNATDSDDDEETMVTKYSSNSATTIKRILYFTLIMVIIMASAGIGYFGFINYGNYYHTNIKSKGCVTCSNQSDINAANDGEADNPLPGIYLMNKGYNMFLGKQIYEQSGVDIITYQFNGRQTSPDKYDIPIEFRSIPNIAPSCDIESTLHNVYYSSSTSVLKEQTDTVSAGYSAEVDLEIGANVKGIDVAAKTQMKYGLMFGQSSTSIEGRKQAKEGYTYSFAMDSKNSYYRAEIDWNADHEDFEFEWHASFMDDLNNLNDNLSNKSILLFVNNWGSHVLTKMQTGSYCKETAYASGNSKNTEVDSFHEEVSSTSANWGFWSASSSSSTKEAKSGTWNNEVQYQFADIFCQGEVEVTTVSCAATTSSTNNPIVISYELLKIWAINDIQEILNEETIIIIEEFFDHLLTSLKNCSDQFCNGKGFCTLDNSIWSKPFINEWDGYNFSLLWNEDDNQYCFCEDDIYGESCDSDFICDCFEEANCCCKNNECGETSNLCSPLRDSCVPQDGNTKCDRQGIFIQCDRGIIFGACGSGHTADCGKHSGICGSGSYTGIQCGYPDLGTYDSDDWRCAAKGVELSCKDSTYGDDLLVGICGSGEDDDCKNECQGKIGILCASIDDIEVDYNDCVWMGQYNFGHFLTCDNGYVATGYCGSSSGRDCRIPNGAGGKWITNFNLQCCKLKYSEDYTV